MTCLENGEVICCPTEKCDWSMCERCLQKWYNVTNSCPACKAINTLTIEGGNERYMYPIYFVMLICFIFLGRAVSLCMDIGPKEFWCDFYIFLCMALFGDVFIAGVICLIGIFNRGGTGCAVSYNESDHDNL
jgi:hypothetical protein